MLYVEPGLPGCCWLLANSQRSPVPWLGGSGWAFRGTAQVHPCSLDRRLRVCAILRTRQGRGWASCPTRRAHAPDPCGSRPLQPTPNRHDSGAVAMGNARSTAMLIRGHALPDVGDFTAIVCRPIPPGHYRSHRGYVLLIFHGHRPSVWGVPGWVCETVKNMDVFDEPTWMYSRRVPQTHPGTPKHGNRGPTAVRQEPTAAGQARLYGNQTHAIQQINPARDGGSSPCDTADQTRPNTSAAFVPPKPKLFDITVFNCASWVSRTIGRPSTAGSSSPMLAEPAMKPSRIISRQ